MIQITLLRYPTCLVRTLISGFALILLILFFGPLLAQTPFACTDGASFVTHAPAGNVNASTGLYQVNLLSPQTATIAAPLVVPVSGNKVNAIGYNVQDNFIWGSATGTSSIVKIGSDGIAQSFAVAGLPPASYTAGDVDQAGNLYLYEAGATTMYKINVATIALTTITLSAGSTLGDISVNADGSRIFGVSNAGDLITYAVSGSNATFTSTDIGLGIVAAAYNTFLDSRGYLYAQHSSRADTYIIDPQSTTPIAVQVGPGFQPGFPSERTPFGDGARCATSEIVSQTPFACEAAGYTLTDGSNSTCHTNSNVSIYKVDFQTGNRTDIGNSITAALGNGHLNGMAFNPFDGYLWAFRLGTNQLVRIGSNGNVKYFPLDGIPFSGDCGPSLFAADIDENGIMYAIGGIPNLLIKIDLNPMSPSYLTALTPVSTTNVPLNNIADIAFNPKDGLLYGVSSLQHVYLIDPITGVGVDLGSTGITGNANVVTVFFDSAGNMYYQISNSTTLYKVKNTSGGGHSASVFKNNLPTEANGDGASCSSLLAGVRISGNVWNDQDRDLQKAGGEQNTVTDDPAQSLTIYLTDIDGFIVASTPVASDGTWFIDRVPDGTFNVTLSNDPALQVRDTNPIPKTLPGNGSWVNTGINFPLGTQASVNSGIVLVGTTLDVPNINFGIIKGSPLPVKLLSFVAGKEGKTSILKWATVEEVNADRFEVERSADTKKWNSIGTVSAKGENAARFEYFYDDLGPLAGINYYRLKMIDKDSSHTYSRISNVNFDGLPGGISLYPNPVAERLFFPEFEEGSVKGVLIVNMSGQTIHSLDEVPKEGWTFAICLTDYTMLRSSKLMIVALFIRFWLPNS